MIPHTSLLPVLILLAAAGLNAAEDGGIALRPAVILVQGVPPGAFFSVQESGAAGFTVINRSPQALRIGSEVITPPRAPQQYERGYEPPPQADWFTMDPPVQEIAPGASAHFDLQARIPDEPQWANRHWMLYIECGPPPTSALGAAIFLRARVLFETRPQALDPSLAPSGLAHLAPSVITMQRTPDGTWQGSTRLGNGTDTQATYDLLRAADLWPEDLAKAHRFFPDPGEAVMPERWARSTQDSSTIAPGQWHKLTFSAQPPALAQAREELVFIARRASADTDAQTVTINDTPYTHLELLRLVYRP